MVDSTLPALFEDDTFVDFKNKQNFAEFTCEGVCHAARKLVKWFAANPELTLLKDADETHSISG